MTAVNTGFKGIDVRQTGNELVFRAFLQTAAGALLTSGTVNFYIMELQSDSTIKTYDFSDNTVKTGAVTTENLAATYRKSNNATTDTGLWTAALATLTGFTVGAMYFVRVNCSTASPTDQMIIFQYGSAEGDLTVTADGTGQADLWTDDRRLLGTAWVTPTIAGTPDVNSKNIGNVAAPSTVIATQQDIQNIGVSSSAINTTATAFSQTSGSVTSGTYVNTATLDSVFHVTASTTGTLDEYYEFTIANVNAVAASTQVEGYLSGVVNTLKVYAYNWIGTTWDQIGTITGISGTTITELEFQVTTAHTSTSQVVRIRFQNTGLTAASLNIDRIVVGYTSVLTPPPNWSTMSIDGSGRLDISKINGDATAAANAALFWHGAMADAGTAQGATSSTIQLRTGANANDDFYKNYTIVTTGGTGAGQVRRINNGVGTAYVGSTKVATISGDRNWTVTPDNTTTYVILGEIP